MARILSYEMFCALPFFQVCVQKHGVTALPFTLYRVMVDIGFYFILFN